MSSLRNYRTSLKLLATFEHDSMQGKSDMSFDIISYLQLFSETNFLARLHNSAVNRLDIPLCSLHVRRNNPVDGFPENGRALVQLSGK